MRAYVLVSTRPGRVRDIARQIAGISGVTMASACWGMPDIFVVAEAGNHEELNKLVIDKIQALDGVERTETHNAFE